LYLLQAKEAAMTITVSRRRIATAAALAALVAGTVTMLSGGHSTASAATASPMASVACVGAKSGAIPPARTKVNGITGLAVSSASDAISIPVGAASGLPTGHRLHKPYNFTLSSQAAGDANIVLANALVTNENLKTCTFRYFHHDVQGKVVPYLTVKLTNAHLTSYSFKSAGTVAWQATYQTIEWSGAAGKAAQDDWEAAAA
jgi:type VI secretion system secreted protein Hcp